MNLTRPEYSYMIGFIQCDGHMRSLTRGRGSCVVELSYRDRDLLKSFQELTPYSSTVSCRIRNTNFKLKSKSAIWSLFALEAREKLLTAGMTYGKKSETITPPVNYVMKDYIRGLIDADGSVGTDARGYPFISFTSKSKALADAVSNYISNVTGTKINPCLNKRDTIYSITLFMESAQEIMSSLYYDDCLCLNRKLKSAHKALKWRRPKEMRRCVGKRVWRPEENQAVLSLTISEAAKLLGRTESSVRLRKWRLLHL